MPLILGFSCYLTESGMIAKSAAHAVMPPRSPDFAWRGALRMIERRIPPQRTVSVNRHELLAMLWRIAVAAVVKFTRKRCTSGYQSFSIRFACSTRFYMFYHFLLSEATCVEALVANVASDEFARFRRRMWKSSRSRCSTKALEKIHAWCRQTEEMMQKCHDAVAGLMAFERHDSSTHTDILRRHGDRMPAAAAFQMRHQRRRARATTPGRHAGYNIEMIFCGTNRILATGTK